MTAIQAFYYNFPMMSSLEENSGLTRKISSAPSRPDDALEFASPCFVLVSATAPGTAPYANVLLAHRVGFHVHPGREACGRGQAVEPAVCLSGLGCYGCLSLPARLLEWVQALFHHCFLIRICYFRTERRNFVKCHFKPLFLHDTVIVVLF